MHLDEQVPVAKKCFLTKKCFRKLHILCLDLEKLFPERL